MKKIVSVLMSGLLIAAFVFFALASGEDDGTVDQGSASVGDNTDISTAETESGEDNTSLGDYSVVIDSCRLATSYDDKPVVIIKYIFSNVSNDDATSFLVAVDHEVYQNGVGLNDCYFVDDSAGYSGDNQNKQIKKGTALEVEVAYELNDTTTDIDVEVKELFSFSDKTITKTFTIA